MINFTNFLIVYGGACVAMFVFLLEGMPIGHLLALTLYILSIYFFMYDGKN